MGVRGEAEQGELSALCDLDAKPGWSRCSRAARDTRLLTHPPMAFWLIG